MAARRSESAVLEDERVLETSRVIDAPRELVFEAWTDPRHLAAWWGPDGFTTTTRAFDMRPGGVWRFVMHGPDGRDYENRITYDEIEPPSRIAYHHGGGDDVEPVQFRTTVTFEDLGGRTRITLRAVFPTAEERDRVVREYGADKGARETVARLADYVDTLASRLEDGERPLRTLVLVRTFDAPRDLVWRAWTEPAHMAAWWGPRDFTNPVCELDVRDGGAIRIEMRAPDGTIHPMTGVFHEVVEPERLIFTAYVDDDQSGEPGAETYVSVSFAERDGGTTITVEAALLSAAPRLARAMEGMHEGWMQGLERLDALLTRPRSTRHETVVIERVFDAPPARVFEAWASVEARRRWQPPSEDVVMEFVETDFRVGGRDLIRCGSPGDLAWVSDARYEDIAPGRRIVQTETVSKRGVRVGSALTTVELAAEGDGARLVFTGQIVAYDGSDFAQGRRVGWTAALDNLALELRRAA